MRKVFWCCLAAGAAVCCAFWAVAYVSQNPESPLGSFVLAAAPHSEAARPGQPPAAAADDLIPPDPVPVVDPSDPPAPPVGPDSVPHLPPAVAALIPPIVIHDEGDAVTGPAVKPEPPVAAPHTDAEKSPLSAVAVGETSRPLEGGTKVVPTAGPPMMPYCLDDADATPQMPPCPDDGAALPAADGEVQTAVCGANKTFDAWAIWMGFCAGPTQLGPNPSAGRCEEDAHYPLQYPGCPYTGRPADAEAPPRPDAKAPPAFPAAEEPREAPAPKEKAVDPLELFSRPHHSDMPRLNEPQSDTMEMRPTDWKPYSLEPGPF